MDVKYSLLTLMEEHKLELTKSVVPEPEGSSPH
jgi:hypothetical protein